MYFCGCSPGRSSPSFQLLVMNPGCFMSFRKGMKNHDASFFHLVFTIPTQISSNTPTGIG